jgi:hypothetical protein
LKELYEIGIVFRGAILVNHFFKDIPGYQKKERHKDLRGPFISVINSFVSRAYDYNALEYFESGNFLCVFKIGEIRARDNPAKKKEPLIFYGLVEKKKKAEKLVKIFLVRVEPLVDLFIKRYTNLDFMNEQYKIKDFEFELLGI